MRSMNLLVSLAACLAVSQAHASVPAADRVLLVPIDSRPAAGQFAQMIGKMASTNVAMPPYELLGRFTRAGKPDAILDWLDSQDYSGVKSVIVSTDMVTYGGLIASRIDATPTDVAEKRLARLETIRKKHPGTQFYAFCSIMRLAPTATATSAPWRAALARYAELTDRYARTKNPADFDSLKNLVKMVPQTEIERYERTRQRNHHVQAILIKMAASGVFSYLTLGQDDARAFGPHVPETMHLKQLVEGLGIGGKVYFCEGIDQLSNVLISRALLKDAGWTPRVRIVYSDPSKSGDYATFESKPIAESLRDQIFASGARPVSADTAADYDLFVNVPKRSSETFQGFLRDLTDELDQNFPVCVADINLAKDGTADPVLFNGLMVKQRMMRLLSFAGWNTAGNSLGTSIPAANVYLLARRLNRNPLEREVAQREFLLHRFVNDYAYHKLTRPMAYSLIDRTKGNRDETNEPLFSEVQSVVRRDLEKHLEEYFTEQFQGKRFYAGTHEYEVEGLQNVKIFLPWPRAYEVRLEFSLTTKEMATN